MYKNMYNCTWINYFDFHVSKAYYCWKIKKNINLGNETKGGVQHIGLEKAELALEDLEDIND